MVYPMLFKRAVIQCSFTVTYFSFLLKIHREYQKRKNIIQRYNHATKCLYYFEEKSNIMYIVSLEIYKYK